MLSIIFCQDDQFRSNGNMHVQYSYAENDFNKRMKLIEIAKMNYESRGMQLFTFGVQVSTDYFCMNFCVCYSTVNRMHWF